MLLEYLKSTTRPLKRRQLNRLLAEWEKDLYADIAKSRDNVPSFGHISWRNWPVASTPETQFPSRHSTSSTDRSAA